MIPQNPILQTKLTPPRHSRHTLTRPRLTALLREARHYRLTLVQAGTGYGKSTALAALADESDPLGWYHLEREDADPQMFLHHLYHALQTAVSPSPDASLSTAPLALLEQWEQNPDVWTAVTDTLVNELAALPFPLFLVIDDVHHLNQTGQSLRILDRFIGRAPDHLHLILASRYPPQLPTLLTWRVRGDLLEIGQETLAFTREEIAALFREQYEHPLDEAEIELLATRSEGWPIALQLVWQRLQDGSVTLDEALGQLSGGDLFPYLAREVLAQQPADVAEFLRETAVLRQLIPSICNQLRERDDSKSILRYLHENGLFLVDLGEGHMRYHHLFRDLMHHQLEAETARDLHRRAAAVYRERGQTEEAIHHLLDAAAHQDAAVLLSQIGREMVQAGRLDTLSGWIGELPPAVLEGHPPLLVYLGDVARLRSHFDEALGWYKQAETRSRTQNDLPAIGQSLRGQARVYLDTVNPAQAETLLQEALRLSEGQTDRESRARLLDLLAENLLNQGRTEKARQFQAQAHELRQEGPDAAEIPVRMLLRTGRLDKARRLLEERLATEQEAPVRRPRAHRETSLILSLILAFQGEREAALQYAIAGTQRGQSLQSQWITAAGHMRQGHAHLLRKEPGGYEAAAASFRRAITISEEIDVPRLKVEAYWGLCQAHGFAGDLEQARNTAVSGLDLAGAAGDEWVAACIRVVLGGAYALDGQYREARQWLGDAETGFRNTSDSYGQAVALLWQSYLWRQVDDEARLERDLAVLLELIQRHDYAYLLAERTLMGPPDPRALVPLLIAAREQTEQSAYAARILARLGLSGLDRHPGYQLRLQLLGPFRAWRGQTEISSSDWKRSKARQIFLLLVTYRETMLEREQICDMLWPELDPESAQRDFKIAYSALLNAIEPARRRHAPSSFIARDDSRYGLRPEADVWLDAAVFEELAARGDVVYPNDAAEATAVYQRAFDLYQGDYLQEYPYEEWCSETREGLLTTFLQTAERLAGLLLAQEAWDETIQVAQAILVRDDCWEQAYRILMRAYAAQGKRAQAARAYQRCQERLQAQLGLPPTEATTALYKTVVAE